MAVYAIGDVQGCYDSLRALLDKLRFDPARDTLWFTGDLVNRGPHSLEVLRFVRALPSAVTVLGNHDLHCLAVAAGAAPARKRDTFAAVLAAPDRDELFHWLRHQPLMHVDATHACAMVHAGLLPEWDIATAQALAREAEQLICHSDRNDLFKHMYGDDPDHWRTDLGGWARIRVIINAFTRLRYLTADGRLDLRPKMRPGTQPDGLVPWFDLPRRHVQGMRIIFGHWSTLGAMVGASITSLDSGCLWGGQLSAWRVDAPGALVQVECPEVLTP